jgi:hypothetical protein
MEKRLPTSGWRSPASSSSRARRALWPQPTSPPSHLQTPPRRAPAPTRCAPPHPWTTWRRALPRPPQTLAPPPPPRLSVRGAWAPTSRGEPAPRRSLPPLPTTSPLILRGRRGRESLLLTQPELLILLFPALPPPDPLLFLACCPLLLPLLRRARARARGVGGSDHAASTVTICGGRMKDQTTPARCE